MEAFHEIGCALDRGFESDIMYLDFAKASDSVCPAKLVSKLKAFGIGDPFTQVVLVLPHRKETEGSSQWNLLGLDRCGVWCSSRVIAWPNIVFIIC